MLPFFSALPPFVGEVVLRGTLSHGPALRCAAHGADAPFVVADTSSSLNKKKNPSIALL